MIKKILLICCAVIFPFLIFAENTETAQIPYVSPETVKAETVNLTFSGEWQCVFGTAEKDWQKQFRKGIPFTLDNSGRIDLDTLSASPHKVKDEAAIYTTFTADKDGFALIGLGCDWWLEAYVNGNFALTTFPDGNGSDKYTAADHPFFVHVKKGENLLAVRVQRGGVSWFFGGGAVTLRKPDAAPAVSVGPWLGEPGLTSVSVRFLTNLPLGTAVEYRKKGDETWRIQYHQRNGQILRRTFHVIRLHDLEPGAEYEYRIVFKDPESPECMIQDGKICSFRMPEKNQQQFSLFFTADLQYSPAEKQKYLGGLLKASHAENCDLLVIGGDANHFFDPNDLFQNVIPLLCNAGAASHPVIIMRGNHELRGDKADQYLDYFGNQDGKSYGVFRFGDTAFLVLDSWEDKPADSKKADYCKYNLDSVFYAEQQKFMQKAMKSETWKSAKRRIVFCHGAPYSHGGNFMSGALQKLTDPWFAGKNPVFRIDLWLTGHTHSYTRSFPGTAVIASLRKPGKIAKNGLDYTYPVFTVSGPNGSGGLQASSFRVDITAEKLTVSAFSSDGTCFDKVEIANDGTITELMKLPHFEY